VSNYGREHWTAVKRVLRYLHKTIDHGIVYSIKPLHEDTKERPILHAFCDSDYADDPQTLKSVTGCIFFMLTPLFCGCLACRKLLLSHPVKLSTTLSPRLASTPSTSSSFFKPMIKLIKIYCDNTSVITLATTSEAVHNQVKHVRTKVHHLRKTIADGNVKVEHKPTATMAADLFTKSLSRVKFSTLIKGLQVQ